MEGSADKISRLLKSGNNRLYKLLLILLAGMCMVVIVWPAGGDEAVSDATEADTEAEVAGSTAAACEGTAEYTEYMETRLAGVLENMEGVSGVSVMITVKDDGERITLKDSGASESSDGESSQKSMTEETVKSDDGSASVPYVTQRVEPEVEGVVVCCRGADSPETALQITNAIQALFDVPAHKIVILESN